MSHGPTSDASLHRSTVGGGGGGGGSGREGREKGVSGDRD